MEGSNMSYRGCFLDLDPTYTDRFDRPLLRMTFDWYPNEIRMSRYFKPKVEEIAREMAPDSFHTDFLDEGSHYNTHAYQSTHNTGGAIMGTDPGTSALNRYLQSWDAHNVFVVGANAFPQNIQYNPTGLVGALTLWAARAIRQDYLSNPRPLM